MIVEFNRNISDVDFGTFGKRTINIQIKLKKVSQDSFELFCWYIYLVEKDGKMSPINNDLVSLSWIEHWINDCIAEIKSMKGWIYESKNRNNRN
jgi:hypothetical protein